MKFIIIILLLIHSAYHARSQNVEPDETQEQNLEALSESSESESEDEFYMQQMVFYKNHPLNINGSESDLDDFPLLEPLLIENILSYRKLLGDFISVYELQTVPGFTVEIIKRMLPYLTVADGQLNISRLKKRFKQGSKSIIIRPSLVPEKSKGFENQNSTSGFQGGRMRMMARYKYQYKDLLQYGIVADQDAGEQFIFNKKQLGFDFYSLHLFARKLGSIKAVALGDYTVNLGQGLIQWQSQAYNKSSSVINIKRQSEVLRPYNSAGEYNFLRGAGITIKKGFLENTLFASYRQLSGNLDYDDQYGNIITSIQISGLHRTLSEIADRNTVAMIVAGSNIKWQKNLGHIGLNAVASQYSLPLLKRDAPYNLYAIKGKNWLNYSADYSFTYHNYHLFGELAFDKTQNMAMIGGLMTSLSSQIDMSILLRSISPAYQSIYGNAFTENTMPSNENGVYMGICLKPVTFLRIDMYADLFKFPWLRYRVDAPGFGYEYFFQVDWQPFKKIEIYSRFRNRVKPLNENNGASNYPQDKLLRNWRIHINYHLTRDILLRSRAEFCWYGDPGDPYPETGFLFYSDLLYKPFGRPWSASARLLIFETGGYNTRLYAYENDVLFSNSTPAFFDKGTRIYFNLKSRMDLKFLKSFKLNLGVKASTSLYSNKNVIGSGQDEINGAHRSEVKIQLFFTSG